MQETQSKYPKVPMLLLASAVVVLGASLVHAKFNNDHMTSLLNDATTQLSIAQGQLANTPSTSPQETPKSEIYQAAIAQLKKHSEKLGNATFTALPMEQVQMIQSRTGSALYPVYADNVIYMTDSTGNALVEPSRAYFTSEQGAKPFTAVVADVVFETVGVDKFPSHPLPAGVQKTGDMFVLTDPTCGYCRKIDEEVDDYLNAGIVVHYVPYPRAGLSVNNAGFTQWASATCSSQSKQEQAAAYYDIILQKNPGKYPPAADLTADCAKIIQDGYLLGRQIGVSGTPFIYTKLTDGKTFSQPGYNKSTDMLVMMGIQKMPVLETPAVQSAEPAADGSVDDSVAGE